MTGDPGRPSEPVAVEAEGFLARARAVAARLEAEAAAGAPAGLTEPDPGGRERWTAGQVWAHLGEFIPYWIGEVSRVAGAPDDGAPFGRTKADPGRVAAIERDRETAPAVLHARLAGHLRSLEELLGGLDPAAWGRSGTHPTLGRMPVVRIVDEFLVGHLEQHAGQLEDLRRHTPATEP